MNKKNRLLTALVLSTTCLLSLAGCKGEQGIKGDTGEKGDQGQKGDSGTPGKDGENGKDGASLLNGEGAPSDTLGNDGDTYIDSLTFDLYIKDNGKWVLKGNTKGDKGDQGEKGDTGSKGDKGDTGSKGDKGNTGSSGSQGTKGDTAWSNTILYSEYGYITPSAASMIANNSNKISFTVHHNDYSNARCTGLTLRNPKFTGGEKTISINSNEDGYKVEKDDSNHTYTFTTKMLEGGFVVSAEFGLKKTRTITNNSSSVCTINEESVDGFVGDDVELTITANSNYRLKAVNNKYYVKVNTKDIEVAKTEGEYIYTCTVAMEENGLSISGDFESKKEISIEGNENGNTVTCEPTTQFANEDVTFTITPNSDDGYYLEKFYVGNDADDYNEVTVDEVSGEKKYTYTTKMVEGLKVKAEWGKSNKLNVDITTGGKFEVYSVGSDGTVGDIIEDDLEEKEFKTGEKFRIKITSDTEGDNLSSNFKNIVATEGNTETTATEGTNDDDVKKDGDVWYKDYTFGTSDISLQVNFEYFIKNIDDLMKFHDTGKYHENTIITVDSNFTSCDVSNLQNSNGEKWTWSPIDYCESLTFNGNGLVIENFTYNGIGTHCGFFSILEDCIIDNLNFKSASVSCGQYGSVLAAKSTNSEITNCNIESSSVTTLSDYTGLLVGIVDGENNKITKNTIKGSNNTVKGTKNVAGFVGYNSDSKLNFASNTITGNLTVNYEKSNNTGNGNSYAAFIGNKADSTITGNNWNGISGRVTFTGYDK